uniref:Uncharacterized protein n=1 Tax=Cajanus cajan TaxID=3821 RepID=A0A151TBT3_CAJCA|nr:hypothetical protein KK1_019112 [Cajanus cajan]
MQKELAKWRNKLLSMVRRFCLINSVLSSLSLFYLTFFKMLKIVVKQIIRI